MIGRGAGSKGGTVFVFWALLTGAACTLVPARAQALETLSACDTPLDLRVTGPVKDLPSGDQGNSYTCGFYAAATYLDAFQVRKDGGLVPQRLPIDSIALAIDLAIEREQPDWIPIQLSTDPLSRRAGRRGSYLCDIVQHVRNHGVCDHGDPRVLDRAWTRIRTDQAVALYETLSKFSDRNWNQQRKTLAAAAKKVDALLRRDGTVLAKEEIEKRIWDNRLEPYRGVRALLYPQCEKNRYKGPFAKLPSCTTDFSLAGAESRSEEFQASIHRLLGARSPLPVPVFHCFQVLREGRAYDRSSIMSPECILHYVTVIGRRMSNGVCQFLIRNSYDPEDRYAVSKDWERDGEDFWVDAEPFTRSAYGIHRLK